MFIEQKQPLRLTTEPVPWDWNPDICQADQDFIEYIHGRTQTANIFHMGSGNHHKVGRSLAPYHTVTSITHCPEEMITYMKLVDEIPQVGYHYKCWFGDIFQLRAQQLPQHYDVVALFHLGELISGDYKHHSIRDLIFMFSKITNCIVFYTKSFAYNELVLPIEKDLFPLHDMYKTLSVCYPS